jgi:hypothetical protein
LHSAIGIQQSAKYFTAKDAMGAKELVFGIWYLVFDCLGEPIQSENDNRFMGMQPNNNYR